MGYCYEENLAKFGTMGEEAAELWNKFMKYYENVFAEGALTTREKSLIALAVATAYCIDAYTNDCLGKGVNVCFLELFSLSSRSCLMKEGS